MRAALVYGGAILAVAIVALGKTPLFPINDPALYEYYGRHIAHGARLYRDLPEVKFPGIYLVNALWQLLFGERYPLHVFAEVLLCLCTVGLFALLLRASSIKRAGPGTLLFAICFLLGFPQFDYPQHYAVFFIVLGIWLSFVRLPLLAGIAIAGAAMFWLPAVLTYGALLFKGESRRERLMPIGGACLLALLAYLALIPMLGPAWPAGPIANWPSFFGAFGFDFSQLGVTVANSELGPVVGALLCLIATTFVLPLTEGQRFALAWSLCALAGTFLPPKWSEHYFIPSVPALVMAVVTFGGAQRAWLRHPLAQPANLVRGAFAVAAVACAGLAVRNVVTLTNNYLSWSSYVQGIGAWIQRGPGPGTALLTDEFIPELYLAADAAEPTLGAIGGVGNGFGTAQNKAGYFETANWLLIPRIIVFGPFRHAVAGDHPVILYNVQAATPIEYEPVCGGRFAGTIEIFAVRETAALFQCGG